MWSSLFRMKSDVLDMPVHRVRDKVARTHERGADADFRTRVHLFFNLLFALAEQEELETNGSQYMNRKGGEQNQQVRRVLQVEVSRVAAGHDDGDGALAWVGRGEVVAAAKRRG